ncbi:BnaC02g47280D [Brassica napus]|uniref:BnaC02g47280D protein n=2 Tax=Brassica TaxID=3705 RepID=A0A078IYM1_BRANA|nr:hypothetical protein F2Q69_00023853 [Brassica cretica]CDY57347.1 BnaC02g47280D [Brassica napus]
MSSSAANFAQSAILRRLGQTFWLWDWRKGIVKKGTSSIDPIDVICQIAGQENFMISYQPECFFDGLLTLMSSLLNYHRRNVDLESARCPPPKGRFLTTYAASKGEKKPAHSDNNDAPAVKLPTEIVEISSDPRTSEEDKVEMPADAYESTQKGRLL